MNRNSVSVNPVKKLLHTNPLEGGSFDFLGKWGRDWSWEPLGTHLSDLICWPMQATICEMLMVEPITWLVMCALALWTTQTFRAGSSHDERCVRVAEFFHVDSLISNL